MLTYNYDFIKGEHQRDSWRDYRPRITLFYDEFGNWFAYSRSDGYIQVGEWDLDKCDFKGMPVRCEDDIPTFMRNAFPEPQRTHQKDELKWQIQKDQETEKFALDYKMSTWKNKYGGPHGEQN